MGPTAVEPAAAAAPGMAPRLGYSWLQEPVRLQQAVAVSAASTAAWELCKPRRHESEKAQTATDHSFGLVGQGPERAGLTGVGWFAHTISEVQTDDEFTRAVMVRSNARGWLAVVTHDNHNRGIVAHWWKTRAIHPNGLANTPTTRIQTLSL